MFKSQLTKKTTSTWSHTAPVHDSSYDVEEDPSLAIEETLMKNLDLYCLAKGLHTIYAPILLYKLKEIQKENQRLSAITSAGTFAAISPSLNDIRFVFKHLVVLYISNEEFSRLMRRYAILGIGLANGFQDDIHSRDTFLKHFFQLPGSREMSAALLDNLIDLVLSTMDTPFKLHVKETLMAIIETPSLLTSIKVKPMIAHAPPVAESTGVERRHTAPLVSSAQALLQPITPADPGSVEAQESEYSDYGCSIM